MAQGFDWDVIDREHLVRIFKHTNGNSKVLDVGCAYGRTAHWWADQNYTGIDFVPEFVEEAKKRHPGKRFLRLDLKEPLPFKDKEFDVALLISVKKVIENDSLETWKTVEREVRRVSKKYLVLEYGMSRPEDIEKWFEVCS